jgi:predicted NACHT family NTPase
MLKDTIEATSTYRPLHRDRRGRSGQTQLPAHLRKQHEQLSLESNMSTKVFAGLTQF